MFYLYLVLCADLINHLCEIHRPHSSFHVTMKTGIEIMALWLWHCTVLYVFTSVQYSKQLPLKHW